MRLREQRENKKVIPGAKQTGFGLIELMVAIALGLLITAAVTAMAVNSLKMSSDTLKSARLNQDLAAVMQIMVNDIRRAGYAGEADSFLDGDDINIVSSNCILYSYNKGDDSGIDDDEKYGFKLSGGNIQMRTFCDESNCMTDTGCPLGTWENMIDSSVINITGFVLNTENSKCHNIDEDVLIQIKPGSSATEFACNETTQANVQEWGVDDDENPVWVDFSGSTTLPFDTAQSVGARNVNISLEAELTRDSSVSKNLNVSIRVRNDHIY